MATSSADLSIAEQMDPRSMSESIEQRAVQKDPPEAACFLTLGNQPCACVDPGAL